MGFLIEVLGWLACLAIVNVISIFRWISSRGMPDKCFYRVLIPLNAAVIIYLIYQSVSQRLP